MAATITLDATLTDSILDFLEEIGYKGPLLEDGGLQTAIMAGLASTEFVTLVDSLTSELKELLSLNEAVTRPIGPEDAESFQFEVRSFLSELNCPHTVLLKDMSSLDQPVNRLILIDFLLTEVIAGRLISLKTSEKSMDSKRSTFESNPYDIASNLAAILEVYGISKPPAHVTTTMIFDKIITKTKDVVGRVPKSQLIPLVVQPLSDEQWAMLDRINDSLMKEYALRRQMLLTRCSVTVQSFRWSDKTKDKDEQFTAVYQDKWKYMKEKAPVIIARVLAAKQDLLSVDKTSNSLVRKNTQCSVNKVVIGGVPDRGGRPNETRPPPEMPGFKKRTEAPREKREGGGRGGRNRGGRGRVQGGWSGGGRGGGASGFQGGWEGGFYGGYSGGWDGGYGDYSGYGGYRRGDYGGYR